MKPDTSSTDMSEDSSGNIGAGGTDMSEDDSTNDSHNCPRCDEWKQRWETTANNLLSIEAERDRYRAALEYISRLDPENLAVDPLECAREALGADNGSM